MNRAALLFCSTCLLAASPAYAGTAIDIPVTFSEPVTYTGSPALNLDVGGVARKATPVSGNGTATLTFRYTTQVGDLDLDGISMSPTLDLTTPGGTVTDLNGNALTPLTFTAPNTSLVKVDHPSLAMDFLNNDYLLSGTHYASLASFLTAAGGTFTRASTATYFDISGNLQTATSGTPRFDYDPITHAAKGILLEPQATNYVQNSQFSGITPGGPYTSASLGTGNHWQVGGAGAFAGSSITITGTGTANGIPYLDLRFQGTNASGVAGYMTFNTPTADRFTVVTGDKTVTSAWMGVSSFTSSGGACSIVLQSRSYDSGGGYAGGAQVNLTGVTSWGKVTTAALTHGATGVKSDGWIFLTATAGATCDITVRFGGLQVEKAGYASSYIPTTTGTGTRQSEAISIPTGGWYNQNAGSFMQNLSWISSAGSNYPMLWRVDDTTVSNRWNAYYNQASNTLGVDAYAGGAMQGSFSRAATTSGSMNVAAAQTVGSANAVFGGILQPLDTSWTPPAVTRLTLGTFSASYWLTATKYYPLRVADSQLLLLAP